MKVYILLEFITINVKPYNIGMEDCSILKVYSTRAAAEIKKARLQEKLEESPRDLNISYAIIAKSVNGCSVSSKDSIKMIHMPSKELSPRCKIQKQKEYKEYMDRIEARIKILEHPNSRYSLPSKKTCLCDVSPVVLCNITDDRSL